MRVSGPIDCFFAFGRASRIKSVGFGMGRGVKVGVGVRAEAKG